MPCTQRTTLKSISCPTPRQLLLAVPSCKRQSSGRWRSMITELLKLSRRCLIAIPTVTVRMLLTLWRLLHARFCLTHAHIAFHIVSADRHTRAAEEGRVLR